MREEVALGRLVNDRARPTYVIAVEESLRSPDGYPRENLVDVGKGGGLRWMASPWSMVVGDKWTGQVYVKIRNIYAGIFKDDEPICFFRVTQTKNTSGIAMCLDDMKMLGDAVGFAASMHADAGAKAILEMDGNRPWRSGEVMTELAELFIPQTQKGVMAWVDGLRVIMHVAGKGEDASVCILNASPLELSACIEDLEDAKLGASRGEALSIERKLQALDIYGAKRTKALQRLYSRTLGFRTINALWMWRPMEG